jgi:hypothetical protein
MLRLVKYYLKFKTIDGAAGIMFEFLNYKLKSGISHFELHIHLTIKDNYME